ncbi:MAG: hypothetical protein R3C59_31020 [Planctomycetaceae bacterium]
MRSFSNEQLYETIDQYVQQKDALIAEAESKVSQKRFGNAEMFGLDPLFADVGLRCDSGWTPASRHWFSGDPPSDAYEHGFDSQNLVRLIRNSYFTRLFVYGKSETDEVQFLNRAGNVTLRRYILEHGRVTECWTCSTSPKQYHVELFQYSDEKPSRSEEHVWYQSAGGWEKASWVAKHIFHHDSYGLLRAYRDSGLSSSDAFKLVFVRPGMGRIRQQQRSRRMFVGYSIALDPEQKDKSHRVYSDAYGIEMNINVESERPVDVVMTAPPSLIHVITQDTGVTSNDNVAAGASSVSGVSAL